MPFHPLRILPWSKSASYFLLYGCYLAPVTRKTADRLQCLLLLKDQRLRPQLLEAPIRCCRSLMRCRNKKAATGSIFNFHLLFTIKQIYFRAKKAEAAFMASQAQLLNQTVQTFAFLSSLPETAFKKQALEQAQVSLLHVTNVARAPSPAPDPANVMIQAAVARADGFISSSDDEPDDCTVCQRPILAGVPIMSTPCNHTFHFRCLRPWMASNNTCPTCRASLVEAIVIDDDDDN